MKFVIAAGGTAGHINPAIALGEILSQLGHEVVFAGTPNRLEATLIPQCGYDFKSFEAYGFDRKKPITIFKSLNSIKNSTKDAKKWLEEYRPNAVIGFGCYVSLAICRAAFKLKIPVVIHEQNSVMGLANKYLSKRADAVCLAYAHADNGKAKRVEITGNPVRQCIINSSREDGRKKYNVPNDSKMLLVFGGSLGAKKINESLVAMLDVLLDNDDLYVVHITGKITYDSIVESVSLNADKAKRYVLIPYENEMGLAMAAADCCISRAGASSIAEISALHLPSLLIPYPLATENHQFYNAQDLVKAGAAIILDDSAVSTSAFNDAVNSLVNDQDLLLDMKDSFAKLNCEKSANNLADVVLSVVK